SAIGTAKGLGAIVRAFDTRPEVKEQIESMDAEFLELEFKEDGSGEGGYAKVMSKEFIEAEMALFARQAMQVDIIITTALIPGKPAPKLITSGMVESMQPGSVIVDLAAEQGGNCDLTEPGKVVVRHGVTIIGYTDLPSRLPTQSSQLYGTNIRHLLTDMTPEKNGQWLVDFDDEVVRGTTVIKEGEITWPAPPPKLSAAPAASSSGAAPVIVKRKKSWIPEPIGKTLPLLFGALIFWVVGNGAPASFLSHFTVFVLACFIGYMVIWNVTASLHTPLMSVTNAISSIIVIGALIQISAPGFFITLLAGLAVLITAINITGGFAVTWRMLQMFRRD
ncbi:MAG: Re/Si-specific NAD(P)(+) transhydrogenase subunit alpha, partial [Methylococcales bacterium]